MTDGCPVTACGDLDCVADGVDRRVARAEVLIDLDAARDPDREPRLLREFRFRFDAEPEHDDIGRQAGAIGEDHHRCSGNLVGVRLGQSGQAVVEVEGDAVLAEFEVQRGGHLGVKRPHDLRIAFDDRDGQAAAVQLFGDFEAEEPAARHDRVSRMAILDPAIDRLHVLESSRAKWPRRSRPSMRGIIGARRSRG